MSETPQKPPQDIAAMSFEDAMKALEGIVDRLDRGDVPLAESIEIYERGAALQKHCEAKLREAEMRVEKIVADSAGNAERTEAFDAD